MWRKLIGALTAVVALTCTVAGATLLWPNTARSTASQTFTARADVDHTRAAAETQLGREYVPAFLTMIDFESIVYGDNAKPRREYVPVMLTAIEFERTFKSVNAARRDNTPPNREKLRNAGWKRILGSS